MRCKKYVTIMILAAMTAALAAPAGADTRDEIEAARNEQNAAEAELSLTENRITSLEATKQNLNTYLTSLNKQLQQLSTDLSSLSSKLDLKKTEVEIARGAVSRAKADLDNQYSAMEARVRYIYEEMDQGLMVTLLESGSVTELMNKAAEAEEMTRYDQERIEACTNTKDALAARTAELIDEERNLTELKEKLDAKQKEIKNLVAGTDTKISEYTEKKISFALEAKEDASDEATK